MAGLTYADGLRRAAEIAEEERLISRDLYMADNDPRTAARQLAAANILRAILAEAEAQKPRG